MDELKVELTQFLEKDHDFEWRFTNPIITKQVRSLSLDMGKPYDMGEDEYIARKFSMNRKSSRARQSSTDDFNPYL